MIIVILLVVIGIVIAAFGWKLDISKVDERTAFYFILAVEGLIFMATVVMGCLIVFGGFYW